MAPLMQPLASTAVDPAAKDPTQIIVTINPRMPAFLFTTTCETWGAGNALQGVMTVNYEIAARRMAGYARPQAQPIS
jgi:hypothetical protein